MSTLTSLVAHIAPLPWTIEQPPADTEGWASAPATIRAADETAVAQVADGLGYAEQSAYARLLAAAPMLAIALREITACARMSGPAGTTAHLISPERMRLAHVALAEAGVVPKQPLPRGEDAWAALQHLGRSLDRAANAALHREAVERVLADHPGLEELGSSDVNCHLVTFIERGDLVPLPGGYRWTDGR